MNKALMFGGAVLFAMTLITGCSRGYRQPYCGCNHYRYRAPSPLPFQDYCGCLTPWAKTYAERVQSNSIVSSDSDIFLPQESTGGAGSQNSALDSVERPTEDRAG